MRIINTKKILILFAALGLSTPIAVYAAADTKSTTVNAVISSTISMTTSGTVALNVTPTSAGSQSAAADTVTVATNSSSGYVLTF